MVKRQDFIDEKNALAPGQRLAKKAKLADSAMQQKQTVDKTKQVRLSVDTTVGHFWLPGDLEKHLGIKIEDRKVLQPLQDDEGLRAHARGRRGRLPIGRIMAVVCT